MLGGLQFVDQMTFSLKRILFVFVAPWQIISVLKVHPVSPFYRPLD